MFCYCLKWNLLVKNFSHICKLSRFTGNFLQWLFFHFTYIYIYTYRVSQEERTKLREGVPYVKLYWYNPKHLCPKLNGFWDNGQIKLWTSFGSTNDSCQLVNFIYTARRFGADSADARLKCISLHMWGRQAGSQQAEWRHRSAFQCDVYYFEPYV